MPLADQLCVKVRAKPCSGEHAWWGKHYWKLIAARASPAFGNTSCKGGCLPIVKLNATAEKGQGFAVGFSWRQVSVLCV